MPGFGFQGQYRYSLLNPRKISHVGRWTFSEENFEIGKVRGGTEELGKKFKTSIFGMSF
jgi:hypothetical protein